MQDSKLTDKLDTGTVLRYSLNGSVTLYRAANPSDPQSRWLAAQAALAAAVDNDRIVFDNALYEGNGLSRSGVENLRLEGGLFSRASATNYSYLIRLQSCPGLVVSHVRFDGKAGMMTPSAIGQLEYVSGNSPGTSYSNLLRLENCDRARVESCEFHDHIRTPQVVNEFGFAQYQGAYALHLGSDCDSVRVIDCNFMDIGYAGILMLGGNQIAIGCLFDNIQTHGIADNCGSGVQGSAGAIGCTFQRLTPNPQGLTGGIDVNAPFTRSAFIVDSCVWSFPYDTPSNGSGAFCIKAGNLGLLSITNTAALTGNVSGTVGEPVAAFVKLDIEGVRRVLIKNCSASGGISSVGNGTISSDIVVEDSELNTQERVQVAVYAQFASLRIINSKIHYQLYAIQDRRGVSETRNVEIRNSDFIPNTVVSSTTNIIRAIDMDLTMPETFVFDQSNKLIVSGVELQYGLSNHRISNSPEARLALSTISGNGYEKLLDPAIDGQTYSHPLRDPAPFYGPVGFVGKPGMTVRRNGFEFSTSPSAEQHVSEWRWTNAGPVANNWIPAF